MENIFMHFYRKELDEEKKSEPCIAWGWDVRFLDVDCEKYRNQMKHQISSLALAQMEILLIFEQAKHRPFFEISHY